MPMFLWGVSAGEGECRWTGCRAGPARPSLVSCVTGAPWRSSASWPRRATRSRTGRLKTRSCWRRMCSVMCLRELIRSNAWKSLSSSLPPEEVWWESSPHGTSWLEDRLRLDKGGFAYWWRSHLSPVPNHRIRKPVRFWSQEGPDEAVLQALADRRFDDLPRLAPSPQAEREYLAGDVA